MTKKQSTPPMRLSALALLFGLMMFGQTKAAAETYEVRAGDTLSRIAELHQLTVEQLKELNKVENPNLIRIGQVLRLSDSEDTEQAGEIAEAHQEEVASAAYQSHLSQADAEAKEIIAFRESSGSYTAQNGQYYGRYQLTISYLNGDLSPENQERVADEYVSNRYGSWSAALAFWNANGWY